MAKMRRKDTHEAILPEYSWWAVSLPRYHGLTGDAKIQICHEICDPNVERCLVKAEWLDVSFPFGP